MLNVVDWGTCYQVLEPLEDMTSETVWQAFIRSWMRTFGMPEMVIMDHGREFVGNFSQHAAEYGG